MAQSGQQDFSAAVDAWVQETTERLEAVFKESTQRIIAIMQEPGYSVASVKIAIKKGIGSKGRGKKRAALQGPIRPQFGTGNLPVASGFLRASLMASTTEPPAMERPRPQGDAEYNYTGANVTMTIIGAKLGQTIYACYTANYAAAVEYGAQGRPGRGFVRLAAMQWQTVVNQVVSDLKGAQ
jgi:hypothetical protein